jgi:S1-C subfamily serine protease
MIGVRARAERNAGRAALLLWVLVCVTSDLLHATESACASADSLVASATSRAPEQTPTYEDFDTSLRIAWWPFTSPRRPPLYESNPRSVAPHPAVARVIVPEGGVTAFGSGTLVDVREQYGLVVTNWHVVCDSKGIVEVVFPCGFRSHARPLKVDSDWDLAALVIWRPQIEPVKIAAEPPRTGEPLTIHGYGRGQYRMATGRCTAYYAPHRNFPMEMVELDVEARQGDSGGPILNQRGEIAGVLFGAGQGTTLGSFAPRVSNFLASLAPDIGQAKEQEQVAVADRPAPNVEPLNDEYRNGTVEKYPSAPWTSSENLSTATAASSKSSDMTQPAANNSPLISAAAEHQEGWSAASHDGWYDRVKSCLAIVGLLAIALRIVKTVS